MNAIILGGQSPRHKEWVRDLALSLSGAFSEVRYLDYDHWDNGSADINLDLEVDEASKLVEGWDDYVVVAKSIGTVVATLAVSKGLLNPKHCVFLGFPLFATEQIDNFSSDLLALPHIDFVHNEFDKVAAASSVKVYLESIGLASYTFETIDGNDTHDYLDFNLVRRLAVGRS